MANSYSYIPGKKINYPYPLARFLPPLPEGVAAEWLLNNIPSGGIILDPYGSSPNLIVEIARAGYSVIVAANNPISRFLIEMMAQPPDKLQLKSTLAELSAASKGRERIEPFVRMLYSSECPQCGRSIEVEAFLWEKESPAPYGKIISCPFCGESGEHPVSQSDIEASVRYSSSTLHHARALERIAPPRHPDRIHAEEAISVYLPRALYVLFTLINKIDALDLPEDRKKLIDTLLLSSFDRSNNLWGYPTSRERPKALISPNRFRENNIWMSLEKGIELWGGDHYNEKVNYTSWPSNSIEPKTIYLYEGRLRNLVTDLRDYDIYTVLTALPRPNQAFWSLSVLWSGWLWGSDSLGEFISAIRRRRYDWNWHTTALYAANKHLTKILNEDTSLFGIIGEAEIGFITSAIIAANNAGLQLAGIAPRFESGQVQITWRYTTENPKKYDINQIKDLVLKSGINYLQNRGEPANYLRMYTASLEGIYKNRLIIHPSSINENDTDIDKEQLSNLSTSPSQDYSNIQTVIRRVLNNPANYRRYKDSESIESGFWGLIDNSTYNSPLSDKVEKLVVNILIKNETCTIEEIDQACCDEFPGLYTPSLELLHICLESYALLIPEQNNLWQLREEDTPSKRQQDIRYISQLLIQLGENFGYEVLKMSDPIDRTYIQWRDSRDRDVYNFYPIASAVIGDIILNSKYLHSNPIIVLPGGRANLVAYKVRRDPRLAEKTNFELAGRGQWLFLKYRHLRWLSENPLLSVDNFDEQLILDPLTYTTPQLRLL